MWIENSQCLPISDRSGDAACCPPGALHLRGQSGWVVFLVVVLGISLV